MAMARRNGWASRTGWAGWLGAGAVALGAGLLAPGALSAAEGAFTAITGPEYNPYVPLPENISTYGGEIDHLFMLILWLTGVTFVVTEALVVYAMLKFRHRDGAKSQYIHGSHKLEVVWTITPGLILFGLAVYQLGPWKHIKMDHMDPKAPDVIHVQVLAKQFEWNFRYAGEDKIFGRNPATPDDDPDDMYQNGKLVIPKGAKVVIEMRSTDVIHSLFLPHFRFKQDVMPGMTVYGWFEATKTTKEGRELRQNPYFNYEIACAELCGPQHGRMRAEVIILEKDEFEAWKKAEALKQQSYDVPEVWMPMAERSESNKALGWDSPYALGVMPEPPKGGGHGAHGGAEAGGHAAH